MISNRKVIVLAVAILVTIPLLYFSLRPIYLVKVLILQRNVNGVHISRNDIDTYQRRSSAVYFDIDGYVDDKSISKVVLSVRPVELSEWYTQGEGFYVTDGFFSGTVQLGSAEWPVTQDERYSFKLTSLTKDGPILVDGDIDAHVKPISGSNPFLIAGIGLLASILQIISGVFDKKRTTRFRKPVG